VRRLMASGDNQSGFQRLVDLDRADLTVEWSVLLARWRGLLSDQHRDAALLQSHQGRSWVAWHEGEFCLGGWAKNPVAAIADVGAAAVEHLGDAEVFDIDACFRSPFEGSRYLPLKNCDSAFDHRMAPAVATL
jgi:hypothetical protein